MHSIPDISLPSQVTGEPLLRIILDLVHLFLATGGITIQRSRDSKRLGNAEIELYSLLLQAERCCTDHQLGELHGIALGALEILLD